MVTLPPTELAPEISKASVLGVASRSVGDFLRFLATSDLLVLVAYANKHFH